MSSAPWPTLLTTAVLLSGIICLKLLEDYWTRTFKSEFQVRYAKCWVPALNVALLAILLLFNDTPSVIQYLFIWFYFASIFYAISRPSGKRLLFGSLMPTLHLCLLHFMWSVLATTLFYPRFGTPVHQVLRDRPSHLSIALITFVSASLLLVAFKRHMPAKDIQSFTEDSTQLNYAVYFVALTYTFLLFDTTISYAVSYCSKTNSYLLFASILSFWLFILFWAHILRVIKASQYERAYEDLRKKISQQDSLERHLESLAFRDHLTGCYTRNYLECMIANSDCDTPYAAIYIDLNGLKMVNDQFGHATGDIYLQQTTQILTSCIREGDILARLGGDEFLILIPHCCYEEAECILTRAVETLRARGAEQNIPMSLSYGIAVRESGDSTPLSELIKLADMRMYQFKQHHRKDS